MADEFDVIVIGGGPGGYNCAIRAAQLGMTAACIDKRGPFGGTCLNVGCIPSKALLHASELFETARTEFAEMGIQTGSVKLDLAKMMARKAEAVDGLTKGVEYLFKKHKIEGVKGKAELLSNTLVHVETLDGTERELKARKGIVIATGSEVATLPGVEIDGERVVTSDQAIGLSSVPKKLIVVGGGYIGLELGSVWRRLGAEVTVVEYLDRITPGMDGEVSKQFQRILEKQGMTFRLGMKVAGVETLKTKCKVAVEPAAGGDAETLEADVVLISIGRRPFTDDLGLEIAGVAKDPRGFIQVNDHFQTTAQGVFAIGDVIGGAMLAHKAEDEAVAVAEMIAGQPGHVDHDLIPGVVYTWPEVAYVGKTEEALKEAGIPFKKGKFPFSANSRGRTNHQTDGFVKVLAHAETDQVLGVHMIGPNVGEMIAEACVTMEFGGSSEDIARTCHPHPTLTEALRQAAMGVEGWTMQM